MTSLRIALVTLSLLAAPYSYGSSTIARSTPTRTLSEDASHRGRQERNIHISSKSSTTSRSSHGSVLRKNRVRRRFSGRRIFFQSSHPGNRIQSVNQEIRELGGSRS